MRTRPIRRLVLALALVIVLASQMGLPNWWAPAARADTTPTLSVTSGPEGTQVSITGNGTYSAGSSVQASFKGGNNAVIVINFASGTVNSSGNFSIQGTIPPCPRGAAEIDITSTQAGSLTYRLPFTITPTLNLDQSTADPNTTITASGKSFAASSLISFQFSGGSVTEPMTIIGSCSS